MKKALIVITVFVAAVGLFFVFKSVGDNKGPERVASFRVAVLDTDVSRKQASGEEFIKIEKEAEAFAGDQLKTSTTGRATILQPNDTIANLGKNTTITLAAIDPTGGSRIKLESGDIWSKIKRLSGQDYEVETENMVAAVRGTAFAVRFYGTISELFVFEGTVRAKVKDYKTGQLNPLLEIDIFAGFKLKIDSQKLPETSNDLERGVINGVDLEPEIIKNNLATLDEPFKLIQVVDSPPTKTQIQQTAVPKVIKPILTKEPSPTPTNKPTPTPTLTPTSTTTPVSTKKLEEPTPTPTPTPVPYRYYQLQNDGFQEVF